LRVLTEPKKIGRRPNLSVLALISFVSSFAAARAFTILNPRTVFVTSGYHIHHFWYGIIMLAVGGWIGISYNEPRIDRLAAVIFGAGGGLIGDEVGILLTFQGEYYWTGISYTFAIVMLAFASILILVNKYSKTILRDFVGFSGTRGGFYLAVFLAAVSIAFLIDTENLVIVAASGTVAIVACIVILLFFVQAIRRKLHLKR
jgi:hypothetical protein